MEHHIKVSFGNHQEYAFDLRDSDTADLSWEQAQQWIDEEYVKTNYAATHPAGIAPLADKLLCIAAARGASAFAEDRAWANSYALCAGRATGRINISVSVASGTVAFP